MYEVLELEVNSRLALIKADLKEKGVRSIELLKLYHVIEGREPIQDLFSDYFDSKDDLKPGDHLIDSVIPREIVDLADSIGLNDPGLRELVINFLSLLKSKYKKLQARARSILREQVLLEQALVNCPKNDLCSQLRIEADLERVNREVETMRASGLKLHFNECMSIIALMMFKLQGLGITLQDLFRLANEHVPLDEFMNDQARRSERQGRLVIIKQELAQAESQREFTALCKRYVQYLELEEWERLLKTHELDEEFYKNLISMLKALQ